MSQPATRPNACDRCRKGSGLHRVNIPDSSQFYLICHQCVVALVCAALQIKELEMPKMRAKGKDLCIGCRDNFYNGHNSIGVAECWCYKSAKVVRRWRIGWWMRPTERGAFHEVYTLSCHYAPGKYSQAKELPAHAVTPIHLSGAKPRGSSHEPSA